MGKTIATTHSPSISVFKFKWYARACIYGNTQCSLGFLYNANVFWYTNLGYATEVWDTFCMHNMCTCPYGYSSSSVMAKYAAT